MSSFANQDAPLHFGRDRWSVGDIPITHFVNRPLVVIDVANKVALNRDYAATIEDITTWEEENGLIPEGSVVFLRTGFSKY